MKIMMKCLMTILFVACLALVFSCGGGGGPPEPPQPKDIVAVAGNWEWATSDDSELNGAENHGFGPQTVFEPGGSSKFDNTVDDPEGEEDRYGNVVQRPCIREDPVTGADGQIITLPVFNFKGVTKVSSTNRTQDSGARFPLVGWEAIPADDATLANLQKAYGYSFWVRLNSSSGFGGDNHWAHQTSIVTDFDPEQGYEYVHYYGDKPGDSLDGLNYTQLTAGTWHKVTVVMDISSDECNITQPGWIHQWNDDLLDDFNQDVAEKIQWQIQLQHNGGTARGGPPYDIITGEYEFDLDFYGLELLIEQ